MAKRNKGALIRNRRRFSRYHKRSEDSFDSEMSNEIREVFDQMDIIYGELEANSKEDFVFQNQDLNDLDSSIDNVFEQIGKWLVGYCGCLVQREQVKEQVRKMMDNECLENLLDTVLGIGYQLDWWNELALAFKQEHCSKIVSKDLNELNRRQQRVREVQGYLNRIKERHKEHILLNDRRPFSELTTQQKERLAIRYSNFIQASFPSTSVERLQEIIGKVPIDKASSVLQSY